MIWAFLAGLILGIPATFLWIVLSTNIVRTKRRR